MGIEEFSRIQGSNARPLSVNYESSRIDSATVPVPLVQPSTGGGANPLDPFMGNDFWAMFGGDTFSQSAQKQPNVKATVQKGDDIEKIVRAQYKDEIDKVAKDDNKEKFIKAKVALVEKANKLKKDYILMVGQELVMPGLKKPEEPPAAKAATDEKSATPANSEKPAESATPQPKEDKEGYKLVKGDTLSKIVMDKYFDGKNPGQEKLMAKVTEVAKANGIEEKDYTKLAIGREIKFSESAVSAPEVKSTINAAIKHAKSAAVSKKTAEVLAGKPVPQIVLSSGITQKNVAVLKNGNIAETTVDSATKLRRVQEKDTSGHLLTSDFNGIHTEYEKDGSTVKFTSSIVTTESNGVVVDTYTDSSGAKITKQYKDSGTTVVSTKEKEFWGTKQVIVDENGEISSATVSDNFLGSITADKNSGRLKKWFVSR